MPRLDILGRIDLRRGDGSEVRTVLSQPKRLALLTYLACHAGTAIRRDRLLPLFWPELDEVRARKALNKAVHFLRHELDDPAGAIVIVSRGAEELYVDARELRCDASEFVKAISSGDQVAALELYRGELLPGFYVDGAPEFERFVSETRATMRRQAARASHALARRREQEGQITVAVNLARRAVELADEDERVVRELLELLDRLGDRAGALYAYERFERRMSQELEARPAAETQALIARIRARSARESAAVEAAVAAAEDATEKAVAKSVEVAAAQAVTQAQASLAQEFARRGYEIVRELGRGGMATVYLAREVKHQRLVALKVLSADVGALRMADRFAAEIRVTANLQHPNILQLFDSGAVQDTLYYAMPFIDGETLRARLDREKPLAVDESIALVRAIAGALEYAHKRGIVHRDIKPENILLQDGQPLLADFGIALALSGAGVERITATGLSIGTPQYMSPEQAAGEVELGPRSDIYSLAAVAYELLTGEPPFTGPNTRAVLARVMLDPPRPIRTIRPTVSVGVEEAILRALAKHPADRFASASEFAVALERGSETGPRRWTSLRRPRVAGSIAAAAAMIAVSAGFARGWVPWTLLGLSPGRVAPVLVADFEGSAGRDLVLAVQEQVASTLGDTRGIAAISRDEIADALGAAMLADTATLTPERAQHVAYRKRAPTVIDGRLDRLGANYGLVLRALDVRDGQAVAAVQASARGPEVLSVAHALARRLASSLRTRDTVRLPEIPWRAATPSLAAYRHYVNGYTLFSSNFGESARELRSAVALDSGFADAWRALGNVFYQLSRRDSMRIAYAMAQRHGERLTAAERQYVLGMQYYRSAKLDSALLAFDASLLENPRNADVFHDRGMTLRNLGRWDDAAESFRRAITLAGADVAQGWLNSLATTLAVNGSADSAQRVAATIRNSSQRLDAEMYVAIGRTDWDEAARLAAMVAANPTEPPDYRAHATEIIASAQAARGKVSAAREALARMSAFLPTIDPLIDETTLAIASDFAVAARSAGPADTMLYHFYLRAAMKGYGGDSAGAWKEIEALRSRVSSTRAPSILAELPILEALARRNPAGARALIDTLGPRAWRGGSGVLGSTALQRWLIADAYERIGRLDSAAAYLEMISVPRRMHFRMSSKVGFVHPFAERKLARLYERMDRSADARRHLHIYEKDMAHADAGLGPTEFLDQ